MTSLKIGHFVQTSMCKASCIVDCNLAVFEYLCSCSINMSTHIAALQFCTVRPFRLIFPRSYNQQDMILRGVLQPLVKQPAEN